MKKGLLIFGVVFCLGVAATGWSLIFRAKNFLNELGTAPAPSTAAKPAPREEAPQVEQITAQANTLDRSLARDLASTHSNTLLKQGNFAKLDAEINEARERRVRLVGGYSKLYLLVYGLGEPNIGKNATDDEWRSHFATLEEWKKKSPRSINPMLGLANSWMAYGYVARGDGYANTVSEASMELFQTRLLKAIDELRQAKDLGGSDCPEWNRLMMQAEALYSGDRKAVDRFFEAGFVIDPTYYQLPATRAIFLQTKWGGHQGEMERFIAQTADRVEGDEGKILYFEIVSTMQSDLRGSILRTGLSWDRTKEGYALLKEHYGTDRFRKNMFFYLSSYGNDVPTMSSASDEVGEDYDDEVWANRETFNMMKKAVVMMRESKLRTGQDPGGFSRN